MDEIYFAASFVFVFLAALALILSRIVYGNAFAPQGVYLGNICKTRPDTGCRRQWRDGPEESGW